MQRLPEFAVSLYQQPEIAPLCLRLQDEQGCQVPVLLAYCWHGAAVGPVPNSTINAWMTHAGSKASAAIAPLRQTRTWMKTHWPEAEAIREQIKAAELRLEMQLLEEMETLALSSTPDSPARNCDLSLTDNMAGALQAFCEHYRITMTEPDRSWLIKSALHTARQ